TTSPPAKTTTWSPLWPADGGGIRNVEAWRPLVAKYWASDRVDCVLSIIKKESRGDPRAYNSGSGAEGLMQHLGKYWKNRAAAAGFKDSNGLYASPYNAEANIAAGAYIAGSGSNWYAPWNWYPAYGSCAASGG
ncbi:MAG: transglycosylase SLT domain-containing protein, partial [Chloroflexi bacterium]|nr:transglycosylase SLT domain-containing protein [Chloroflexota bacterium]